VGSVTPMGDGPVRLDVFADVACPWCLVGHRRLERALVEEPAGPVQVRWRAFQLAPEIPPEGIPRREYYEHKFGSPAQVEQVFARVTAQGRQDGISFDFHAAERAVNTRLAHRAVKLVEADGRDAGAAMEALMSAYLERGADVGHPHEIERALSARGLAPADLAARLETGEGEAEVEHDLRLAHRLGLHAVPAFVADSSFAISGAHEPQLLRRLIAAARERRAGAAAA
jgi:predicted DsbA family dithiol-disulfide isomerase